MIRPEPTAKELRSLAHGALAQKDVETAASIFWRIVELEPRSAEDWAELGNAMQRLNKPEQALTAFRKALALDPRNGTWRYHLALVQANQGNFAQAITQHRKAISDGMPEPALSWVEIAKIQQRMRQPRLARETLRKAIDASPRCASAYEVLGDIEAREGHLEEAERSYRQGLAIASTPEHKTSLGHAIGALLEKRRDWDGAFEAHAEANRIRSRSPAAREAIRMGHPPYLHEFCAEGASEFYARWAEVEFGDDLPTPVFLVGFPRSGTTMTEQVIAALPNFRTTDEHAFISPVTTRAFEMFERIRGERQRASDEKASEQGEGVGVADGGGDGQGEASDGFPEGILERLDLLSPAQLTELRTVYWNEVWKVVGSEAREQGYRVLDKHPMRILDVGIVSRIFPRSKIITMIRDPRDCCLSAFFQDLGVTPVSARFLQLDTLGDVYCTIMGFWVDIRDKLSVDWVEIRYEEFVSDFERHARRLVEFIGEAWDDKILEFHKKAAKRTIATPSFVAVTEKVNTRAVGKWARYEKHLGPLVERVRPFLETFGYEE